MQFVEDVNIGGVWQITPHIIGDERGYFTESFREDLFARNIGPVQWVQENESFSRHGVLRGLHFQEGQYAQAKLIRVVRGEIVDVVVDLRADSPTWGKYTMVTLSEHNHVQMFIPRGFAHGFVVTGDCAHIIYKVDNVWCRAAECTLLYDDPTLGISWPLPTAELILSEKDRHGVLLKNVKSFNGVN